MNSYWILYLVVNLSFKAHSFNLMIIIFDSLKEMREKDKKNT